MRTLVALTRGLGEGGSAMWLAIISNVDKYPPVGGGPYSYPYSVAWSKLDSILQIIYGSNKDIWLWKLC